VTEVLPPLLWADFNDMPAKDWIFIRTDPKSDLARLGVELQEGVRLRLYDNNTEGSRRDNILAEGVLARWPGGEAGYTGNWSVHLDYVGYESDFASKPHHWCHQVDWNEEDGVRREWFGIK